jgi:hypothetical protein
MRLRPVVVLATLAAFAWINPIQAGVFEIDFTPAGTWTGTPPGGTPTSVILSAVFTDSGSLNTLLANQVQLVITSNLASGERLMAGDALYLNFNPAKSSDLGSLTFALTGNHLFPQAATVGESVNGFKPDGDGQYDLLFMYSLMMGQSAFLGGTTQTYLITDTASASLLASDFDFLSFQAVHGDPFGPFLAAMHVQNTPNGGSGSAYVAGQVPGGTTFVGAVPAPPSAILLGMGVVALLFGLRQRGTLLPA